MDLQSNLTKYMEKIDCSIWVALIETNIHGNDAMPWWQAAMGLVPKKKTSDAMP